MIHWICKLVSDITWWVLVTENVLTMCNAYKIELKWGNPPVSQWYWNEKCVSLLNLQARCVSCGPCICKIVMLIVISFSSNYFQLLLTTNSECRHRGWFCFSSCFVPPMFRPVLFMFFLNADHFLSGLLCKPRS